MGHLSIHGQCWRVLRAAQRVASWPVPWVVNVCSWAELKSGWPRVFKGFPCPMNPSCLTAFSNDSTRSHLCTLLSQPQHLMGQEVVDETQPWTTLPVPAGKAPVHSVVHQSGFPCHHPWSTPKACSEFTPQNCALAVAESWTPPDAIKHRRGKEKIDLSSAVLSKSNQDKCKLIRNLDNSHIKRNSVSCVCQQAKWLLSCCSGKNSHWVRSE